WLSDDLPPRRKAALKILLRNSYPIRHPQPESTTQPAPGAVEAGRLQRPGPDPILSPAMGTAFSAVRGKGHRAVAVPPGQWQKEQAQRRSRCREQKPQGVEMPNGCRDASENERSEKKLPRRTGSA